MNGSSARRLVGVWVLLMLLLALTVGTAFLPLGVGNTLLNLLIAAVKASLVVAFYMHLRTAGTPLPLVASTGLLWLLLLVVLTLADALTRPSLSAPW